ncbi:MAG TPA: PD-(D/E)XK nuclease family protein [Candidatus Paceibacterota bacterium]
MRTSYSALQTLQQCPQKFKFQVIDRIRAPKSKEAAFGTAVHGALAFMFSHDPLFPTIDEICNRFSSTWTGAAENIEPALDDALWKTYEESGVALIKNFYKKNPPWILPVVDTESRFEVALQGPKNHQTHVIAGIIDRIDKVEDGVYEIIDYKTARKLPSQEAVDHDLQLSLYHMAIQHRWPHLAPENIALSLYFLKHNEKITTHRTQQDMEHTKERVLDAIEDIEQRIFQNNFSPTPSALCEYCSYKPLCPAWKHLFVKDKTVPDEAQLQQALQEYFTIKEDETKQTRRIIELHNIIKSYMSAHRIERVFDDEGRSVGKKMQQRFGYDFEKIKLLLQESGFSAQWEALLSADEKKFKELLKGLSPQLQRHIEKYKVLKKEFITLTASVKPKKK